MVMTYLKKGLQGSAIGHAIEKNAVEGILW